MAFSNSKILNTVWGDKRVEAYSSVADAATGTILTGLTTIENISVALKSATTAAVKFVVNQSVTGTSVPGTVAITGAVSGDEFYVTVYGR